jgi:Tfp pilus assembly PilM family ATPase
MDCELDVDSLDIAPTALRRLVSALYTGRAADNVLMINCYRDDSYLTVISGRRLLFNQAVEFCESLLLKRVAEKLDITIESALHLLLSNGFQQQHTLLSGSATEDSNIAATLLEIVKPCFLDLVEEINRVLAFTALETHGAPVSRVCLLGSVAHWPGAQQVLVSLLDFEAPDGQIEFTQVFEDENDNTCVPWSGLFSDISIAMGLALRGLVDSK